MLKLMTDVKNFSFFLLANIKEVLVGVYHMLSVVGVVTYVCYSLLIALLLSGSDEHSNALLYLIQQYLKSVM